MYEIAVKWPSNAQWRDQWSYVLTNFGVEGLYEIDKPDDVEPIIKGSIALPTVADLPDKPLVLVTPKVGRYLNAENDIQTFKHPDNCIYLFWADNLQLYEDELYGREVTTVYVPTSTHHDMYIWVAGAIVLYDRMIKRG